MADAPLVTVLIVFWKNEEQLPICLERLSTQTYRSFDIVLINNGSSHDYFDGLSIENLQLLHQNGNTGFAVANNIGARHARGKWIALLNADAYPEPDWLENLLKVAERNPGCSAFSSRQLQRHAPHLLDGAGDAYHVSGLAWRIGYNLPVDGNGLEEKEIFSPCAAAALYSREEFLRLGGFDEDYFSYFEDVDFGFRLRLQGGKCLYVPDATVHHVGSASTGRRSDFSVYYGYRNLIWTFFKNMPFPFFGIFLPVHITTVLFFSLYFFFRGQGRVISKAIFDAIRGLPAILEKRKQIQKNLKIKPKDLLKIMSTGSLEPYREFIRRNQSK